MKMCFFLDYLKKCSDGAFTLSFISTWKNFPIRVSSLAQDNSLRNTLNKFMVLTYFRGRRKFTQPKRIKINILKRFFTCKNLKKQSFLRYGKSLRRKSKWWKPSKRINWAAHSFTIFLIRENKDEWSNWYWNECDLICVYYHCVFLSFMLSLLTVWCVLCYHWRRMRKIHKAENKGIAK